MRHPLPSNFLYGIVLVQLKLIPSTAPKDFHSASFYGNFTFYHVFLELPHHFVLYRTLRLCTQYEVLAQTGRVTVESKLNSYLVKRICEHFYQMLWRCKMSIIQVNLKHSLQTLNCNLQKKKKVSHQFLNRRVISLIYL